MVAKIFDEYRKSRVEDVKVAKTPHLQRWGGNQFLVSSVFSFDVIEI